MPARKYGRQRLRPRGLGSRGHVGHGKGAARGRDRRAPAHVHGGAGQADVLARSRGCRCRSRRRRRRPRRGCRGKGWGAAAPAAGGGGARRRRRRERGRCPRAGAEASFGVPRTAHETSTSLSLVASGRVGVYCIHSTDRRHDDDSAGAPRTNRRLTARKACLLTVRYKTAKDWHPATCMDLSRDGCRLRLGEDLERGSSLILLFEAPLADGARSPSGGGQGHGDLGPHRGPVVSVGCALRGRLQRDRRHRQRHLLSRRGRLSGASGRATPAPRRTSAWSWRPSGSSGSRRDSRRAARERPSR